MDLGLRDACAVVSGGSKGMGRAAAECLAAEGCKVAILARNQDDLRTAEEALRKAGATDAIGLPVDLAVKSQIEAAFRQLESRWGELHVLVNAAGPTRAGGGAGGLDDLTDEDWVRTFDIGVMSMVRCVREALPLMRRAGWGRIVNLAATSIRHQSPGLIAYTASKAAMVSVGKNLARSLARENILVNTVCPGIVASPWLYDYVVRKGAGTGDPAKDRETAYALIARGFGSPSDIGRVGLPEEVGIVTAFLCSPRNSFMVGATIPVDGGSDFF